METPTDEGSGGLERTAHELASTADFIRGFDPHQEVRPGTSVLAGLFLGGLGLLLGGVGVVVLPHAFRDISRGRSDAWVGLGFTTVVFVLPGLFCLYLSLRLLRSRGSGELLPRWAWRLIALALGVLILLITGVALAEGAEEMAAPTLFLGWLAYHAHRRARRPDATAPTTET